MKEILKLNEISSKVNDILTADSYNVTADAKNPQAIILRSFSMHDFDTPDSVVAVARAGAGVNNIPLDKMSAKGICVFNTPGANANAGFIIFSRIRSAYSRDSSPSPRSE